MGQETQSKMRETVVVMGAFHGQNWGEIQKEMDTEAGIKYEYKQPEPEKPDQYIPMPMESKTVEKIVYKKDPEDGVIIR